MSTFLLKYLTRDSFVVELDDREYKIDGERYGGGSWEIFSKMVYRQTRDGQLVLVEDEALKAKIVAALREHWDEYGLPLVLLPNRA